MLGTDINSELLLLNSICILQIKKNCCCSKDALVRTRCLANSFIVFALLEQAEPSRVGHLQLSFAIYKLWP